MLVSVIIVNYRAYDELERCLLSLCPTLGTDVEVLVIDQAAEPERVAQVQKRHSWVTVVPLKTNTGFAGGVNRGAALAQGSVLLLVNPDVEFFGDVPHALAEWLMTHPEVGVVGPLIRDQDGSTQASARRFPGLTTALGGRTAWLTRAVPGNILSRHNLLTGPHVQTPIEVDWVSGACMMIRREAFDAVGGMDEGFFLYWEDADLCFRLKQRGWKTMYYPGASVLHLVGRGGTRYAEREALTAFHRSAFRYYKKHAGAWSTVFGPAVFLGLQLRLAMKRAAARGRRE